MEKLRGVESEKSALAIDQDGMHKALEKEAADLKRYKTSLQAAVESLVNTVKEHEQLLHDFKARDIARRGEIAFLKEENAQKRAASEWLLEHGPHIQDELNWLESEVVAVKARGAEMAKTVNDGVKHWEAAVPKPGENKYIRDLQTWLTDLGL